ncbi:MAG: hypothetical protein ACK4GN_16225 [Runella sp.]
MGTNVVSERRATACGTRAPLAKRASEASSLGQREALPRDIYQKASSRLIDV